uniref:C2H2-type domain-containing protein n=1 Tax=Labrus bergylta TaxID=56723 RepID=A0A3Q3H3I5_9LABR
MLTCDICGEQLLLEDDLKTHLLLSHEENDMRCPLCSLSGVSYDQLRFHVSSAHPEERDPADQSTSKHTGGTHTESCRSRETASFTSTPQRPKTRPESSSHRKAKQKRLSSTTKDDQLQCPLCPLLCSTGAVLQEHVELHLMEQRSPGGNAPLFTTRCCINESSYNRSHSDVLFKMCF